MPASSRTTRSPARQLASLRSRSPVARHTPTTALSVLLELSTEAEFFDTLPILTDAHGEDAVRQQLCHLFSGSQVDECFTRLKARSQRLVWLLCDDKGLAVIVTDLSLNEVGRFTQAFSKGNKRAELLVVEKECIKFLAMHAQRRTCTLAGLHAAHQSKLLSREMPALVAFLGPQRPLDLCRDGVPYYAELLGRSMLASPEAAQSLAEFEAKHARERVPAQPALDQLEADIVALGWAREYLLTPPKAAKYVSAGIACFGVFLLAVSLGLLGSLAVSGGTSSV